MKTRTVAITGAAVLVLIIGVWFIASADTTQVEAIWAAASTDAKLISMALILAGILTNK